MAKYTLTPDTPHGRPSTYVNYRCRCQPCRDANAAYMKYWRKQRTRRLLADPTLREHGTEQTYSNWGCRCQPCRDAHAAYNYRLYWARKAEQQ
jgi:hypothetical protein